MFVFAKRRGAWIPAGALLAILSSFAPARGGEPEPLYGPIDTIDVVADADPWAARIERLPLFASVRDLEEADERLLTIADILEESAGVRVRRFGGLGAYATASIRGSASGQVEIYLDGVPLNSAQWGAINLAELPVDNLVRAEIFRSGAPAEFGTAGIGGVVNLVTRPAGTPHTSFAVTGGSYDTWKTTALRSGRLGRAAYILSYRHLQTRGDFEFHYDPGTRFQNAADDTTLTRENNAFREHALLGKLRLPPLRGWRLTLQDDWYLKESGLPGHGNLIYEEASFDNRRHQVTARAESPRFLRGRLRSDGTAYHLYRRERYSNPGGEPTLHRSDLIHRSTASGGRGLLTGDWVEARQTWKVGAEWREERFTPVDENPAVGEGFTRSRRVSGVNVEDEVFLLRERFTILAGWRVRESEDNFHGYLPYGPPPGAREEPFRSSVRGSTVGARAEIAPGVTFKASRNEDGRFPTLYELFGTNGDVRPNPDLVPERGVTWDGGFRLGAPARGRFTGDLEVSAFRSDRDSLIVFIQNSQQSFKAVNLERAVAEGIEIEGRASFGGRLRVDGSFTSQDVRQRGTVPHWDGKWLPYVSPRELLLRTSLRFGAVTLRHEFAYLDRYYRDRANTEEDRAAARRTHDLGARARFFRDRMSLDLDVQNVSDLRASDSFGYPMPGRTVYVTVAWDGNDTQPATHGE
ncbi:MAG: TonB-dependent receptor [Candidatus Eisenbacteria bacterium]